MKKLVKVCSVRKFESQAIIFEQGDIGADLFIILSGSVRVLVTAPNGQRVEIALLKAGAIFGEMSLLEGLNRSATIQVVEEATTVAINDSNFESVISQNPSLALRIMKCLSQRVRRQNTELAEYKDRLDPNPKPLTTDPLIEADPPIDTSPLTTIDGIIEEHKLEYIPECDDFGNLIQLSRKYNKMAPLKHSEYLFDKKIPCPVCDQTIDVKLIRSSKLKLKQIEPDYRQVYTDFDPLWYIVWVCPHCYYANFSTDFPRISDQERRQIKELSSKAKDTFGPYPDGALWFTQVLTSYYLMLYWLEQVKTPSPNFEKLGKLWLRLSWLYHDVQEAEMSVAATKKALAYFLDLLNGLSVKTTVAQDQYLYLLVGELSLKLGNITEAKTYFRQSIVTNAGNVRMKQQAQNRIQELKSLV